MLFFVLAGVIIGLWVSLSFGTFLVILLFLTGFFMLRNILPKEDRSFILKVILIALSLRVLLLVFYSHFYLSRGYPDILGPDGEVYSQRGWYISRLLLNQDPYVIPDTSEYIFNSHKAVVRYYNGNLPPVNEYQIGAFSYLIGILYTVFGYSPLMVKLINSVLSVFTAVIVYFIGKELFNSKIARASMALAIFLPSIFIHSITSLREPAVIFLLTAIIWLIMRSRRDKNMFLLVLALALGLIAEHIRRYTFPMVILLTGCTLLFGSKVSAFKKLFIAILVFVILISVPSFREQVKNRLNPDLLFSIHIGYINTKGDNYKIFPDRCYNQSQLTGVGPIEIAGAFIRGIFHLLYEPLPYKIHSKGQLFAFFQTVLVYIFMPFAVIGLCICLRYRFYKIMPIFMFLVIFIPLMAIREGNVGTVFRHRDMLMPFIILLGFLGCYAKLGDRNPRLLK